MVFYFYISDKYKISDPNIQCNYMKINQIRNILALILREIFLKNYLTNEKMNQNFKISNVHTLI